MLTRRTFAIAAALAGLSARDAFATAGDTVTIGRANARVHVVEYASMTCPHCAHFHETNWQLLSTNYIQTGRVKLTLSEMLTPPDIVSYGMFQLARCNTTEAAEYFRRVGVLFTQQQQIISTGSVGGVRDALISIGAEWSLTQEQVMAALNDPEGRARIERLGAEAGARNVSSTPTFFIDGERVSEAFQTPSGMTEMLDARL
jgi:protein-disulfide isomerase